MSQETSLWLNQNTLIGFTEKRGHAWHYRKSDQGADSNHYTGAVPVEDVRRRLFHWKAVEGDVRSTVVNDDGVLTVVDPTRKTIIRPDTQTILGIFKQGYQIHDYDEWLLKLVEQILDDDLAIGSAGLLKMGGVAWVSVEVPENIVTPEGVEFRPNLLAATSLDGSLSSTYTRCVTNVVCDNTMAAGLTESGQKMKVKHSRYSQIKINDARDALALVHTISDEFAEQVAQLTNVTVSDGDFQKFLDEISPIPQDEGRAQTMATSKQETLRKLWNNDTRVTPWRNTAWGVVQAVNTATHHEFTVRGMDRAERNALRAVTGGVETLDRDTLKTLAAVQA